MTEREEIQGALCEAGVTLVRVDGKLIAIIEAPIPTSGALGRAAPTDPAIMAIVNDYDAIVEILGIAEDGEPASVHVARLRELRDSCANSAGVSGPEQGAAGGHGPYQGPELEQAATDVVVSYALGDFGNIVMPNAIKALERLRAALRSAPPDANPSRHGMDNGLAG